jgi:Ribonuclease G/E
LLKNQYLQGPRISAELLAGRFIVLVPFSDRVSISQKIETRRKDRLKRLYNHQTKSLVLLFVQ